MPTPSLTKRRDPTLVVPFDWLLAVRGTSTRPGRKSANVQYPEFHPRKEKRVCL